MTALSIPNESPFDSIRRTDDFGHEFWSARDLMPLLGYPTWQHFIPAIERAMKTADNQGHAVDALFTLDREKSGGRPREDFHLSRFAAYLVAMNGDPRKPEVAAAQAYFAIQTRVAETAPMNAAAELSRTDLARMVIAAEEERAALEAKVEADAPAVEYVERFVAQDDDLVTVDNFAAQYATTGPAVRQLLADHGVAVRRQVGSRWSSSQNRMVAEHEWRPRAGQLSAAWFELRPQHNAPRLHNGQVRQTMYVRQFHAETLARKLGLA